MNKKTSFEAIPHPEQIKADLRIAGWTQAKLADDLSVAQSSVTQTIAGQIRSNRIRNRIAEILGKPVSALWSSQVVLRRSRREIEEQRSSAS